MKSVQQKLAFMAVAAPLVAPAAAQAAAINIDDTTTEGTIIFGINDFEGGFSINGQLVQQGLHNPATVSASEDATVTFSGDWISRGLVSSNNTVVFVEAQDPSEISDILTYNFSGGELGGHIDGTFTSDTTDGSLGSLAAFLDGHPNAQVVVEDGTAFPFSAPFLGGFVQSDVDPVPEPASMTLFGAALAGLGIIRRKR